VAVLALLAAGGVAAWMLLPSGDRADPGDPVQVALGETIYAQHCASCHGADLQGQSGCMQKPDGRFPAPPHDATGHTWHHPEDMLFKITRQGMQPFAPPGYESDMPAFEGTLTDDQIRAVLAFIVSTWPENIQARWRATSQQSKG
jgi:mono/diheme cytochrome c family protein